MAAPSSVTIFNPAGHPSLAPAYSHVSTIRISPTHELISFAGQTGTNHSTTASNAPSFQEQIRAALANVDKCLAATNSSKADIISNRKYVVGLLKLPKEDLEGLMAIFVEWWRGTEGERLPPPDTLIGVESLYSPECLFEIEVTAVRSI